MAIDNKWNEVMARCEPMVNKHARSYVRGMEKDDVRQELRTVLWEKLIKYGRSPRDPKIMGLASKICQCHIIDLIRKAQNPTTTFLSYESDFTFTTTEEGNVETADNLNKNPERVTLGRDFITRALKDLHDYSQVYHDTLLMTLDGTKTEDVANENNLIPITVRTRIVRARIELKKFKERELYHESQIQS